MSAPASRPATAADLARLLGGSLEGVAPATALSGLCDDSRQAGRGDVFLARAGSREDGVAYARDAVARGAVLVVAQDALPGLPVLRVAEAATALRVAADAWHGTPQAGMDLVGITGTKGKTTTSMLVAAALRAAGRRPAVIGTIAYDLGDGRPEPASNTTPGVLELRRLLARARAHGCDSAVMEVSSHALHQGRTAGLDFRAGVFTNLASDHLDYHKTLDAYRDAKALLFRGLGSGATAVLNRDDAASAAMASGCRARVLTYGAAAGADLRFEGLELSAASSRFRLCVGGREQPVHTSLVGRHNVLNLLAAVGAAMALGVDPLRAAAGASALQGVRGRLERVDGAGLHVFVDYAHTEESLRQVLGFLRDVGARPLACVVGCGGDRDRTKRPRMARVACEQADRVVFTSDNPRTEDPQAILAEMLAGLDATQQARALVVPDRREAIRRAVLEAPDGASVLVAGKGHEDYQIVGSTKLPFDDVTEVREALRLRAARAGGAGAVGARTA
ncbi:MAG: UDP-N-acetylmuramoyl-L-alanyl-D-glutamate--2,6-diaminopimelate ligase [Planctomycetia bacterium]